MSKQYSFGLIGENIGYSRSPAIFEAIFDTDHVNGTFDLFEVDTNNFEIEFRQVLQSGVRGLSVTIPHKERIIPFMHDLDPAAQALAAVNAIAVNDELHGFNTDVHGFTRALSPHRDKVAGKPALILGGGGAARAAVYALRHDFGIRSFTLTSRRIETLDKATQHLQTQMPDINLHAVLPEDFTQRGDDFGLAVNATPLGGPNFPDQSPLPKAFDYSRISLYYDLNYNDDNRLVGYARDAGVTALDGSEMLVAQALESYRRWTGRTVAFDPVYGAAFPSRTR